MFYFKKNIILSGDEDDQEILVNGKLHSYQSGHGIFGWVGWIIAFVVTGIFGLATWLWVTAGGAFVGAFVLVMVASGVAFLFLNRLKNRLFFNKRRAN